MPVVPLPRAARSRPEASAVAVAAAAIAATTLPLTAPPKGSPPGTSLPPKSEKEPVWSAPHTPAAATTPAPPPPSPPLPPRGRVGYALRLRQEKTRHKATEASALAARPNPPHWQTRHAITRWLQVVIDSGCTWHVHNNLDDLINVVPCSDVIVDANGHSVTCGSKGDLPLLAKDSLGKEFHIVLRGVRYSLSFEDTLISVDQLWYSSAIDTRSRDMRHLLYTKSKSDGKVLAHFPLAVTVSSTCGM